MRAPCVYWPCLCVCVNHSISHSHCANASCQSPRSVSPTRRTLFRSCVCMCAHERGDSAHTTTATASRSVYSTETVVLFGPNLLTDSTINTRLTQLLCLLMRCARNRYTHSQPSTHTHTYRQTHASASSVRLNGSQSSTCCVLLLGSTPPPSCVLISDQL